MLWVHTWIHLNRITKYIVGIHYTEAILMNIAPTCFYYYRKLSLNYYQMDRVKRIWYLSHMRAASQEGPSDRKPDPWPFWMAGHAQLKFVMSECSKTQIRLTGLKYPPYLFLWTQSSCESLRRLDINMVYFTRSCKCSCPSELPHDKTNKMTCLHEEPLDLSYLLNEQQRLWSDWANGQADLSLCWAHSHFVGFVMRQLIFLLIYVHNFSLTTKSRQNILHPESSLYNQRYWKHHEIPFYVNHSRDVHNRYCS